MNYIIREMLYSLVALKHRFNTPHLKMEFRAQARPESVFEGYNKLSHHAFFGGHLGYGSYIGPCSSVTGKIGRYCSIAENVHFLGGTHPVTGFVSSHPCFYSTRKQSGFTYVAEQKFEETRTLPNSEHAFIVGNDVYIGYGATLIGPVVIGDGAVIAANATVTKDVPPYTIVGGTPAKEIKKRFSDEDIEYLMKLKWWDKDRAWISKYAKYFHSVSELRHAIEHSESE